MGLIKNYAAGAFNSSRYSWLSLNPILPYHDPRTGGSVKLKFWRNWAKENGILDKHGDPSYSKVKSLIRYHCLGAKKIKSAGNRGAGRGRCSHWFVGIAFEYQLSWTPKDWQNLSKDLFSRSQSNRAKHKRK